MRVKSIGVKGLFGVFDHEIPLSSADRVTIVHGPNGYGKTVMLRMIAAVLTGNTYVFTHTPFNEFFLKLEDGSLATVRRIVTQVRPDSQRVSLEFSTTDATGNISIVSPQKLQPDVPRSVLSVIDKLVPGPFRISGGGWVDDAGRRYSVTEILELFPNAASVLPPEYRIGGVFETLGDLQVFFVETNRLGGESQDVRRHVLHERQALYFEDGPMEPVPPRVKQYSDDVVKRVQSVLADYAKHSQESDRTFPERLVRFAREGQKKLAEREILSRMSELETKRQRLISLGLLDSEKGLQNLSEGEIQRAGEALTIYVADVKGKLDVFDDMATRIGSLMDIVNNRFKYKPLQIDRQQGFRVLSDLDQTVQIEDLSSGEQHQLVLFYEFLFRAPKNGLVLIDEPEISLHVLWQSSFLSDLIRILSVTDAYAIVATHSPVIIGPRTDLTIELKGPVVAAEPVRA